MKLQINQSGAWRNVIEYPIQRDAEVREHAVALVRLASLGTIRILDATGAVAASWDARQGWVEYPFRRAA